VAVNRVAVDPDVGIPDLIRQLGDDSKRLVQDEVRLAKLEMRESVHRAGRGAVWLGVAFGVGVVMLVALTLFVTTLIGRLVNGHMWVGALLTGLLELVAAVLLIKRGASTLAEPSYSLEATRATLKQNVSWVKQVRE